MRSVDGREGACSPGRVVRPVARRFHAEEVRVVLVGEFAAIQRLGPPEAELFHDGRALEAGLLAHHPAGGDRDGHLLGAHGGVERAQEELEVAVASVLNQRGELVQLDGGFPLILVAHQVGHSGHVVANVPAHGDIYWLTSTLSLRALRVHGTDG